ncbi:MAG: LCP family protein [Anaerolineaceae bacterium]|nr:LCP family protein [Anaerolineaceae bacterium]
MNENRNWNPNYQNYTQNAMPVQPMNNTARQQAPKKKKKKAQLSAKHKILLIFSILGIILGCCAFTVVNKYVKQLTVIEIPGAPIISEKENKTASVGTDSAATQETEQTIEAPDSAVQHEKWDGKTRITCLAMGLDYRDWVANDGTPRSDTMMLITYDPVTKEAGMLSLPRDLWVAIPGHGYGRINTAYSLGEAEKLPGTNGKPGGGPGLAMQTVEMFLGVDIQYYAVVDFYGFMDFIDAIDTLAINVRDDIWVDPLGPGNTVHLMAGVQDLDGATALAYARYRYTNGGDFERAERQQDVVFAIFEQLKWQLPELVAKKFDVVFASVQRALKTNIPMDDLLKLAWTAIDIDPWSIKREVIAPPYQVEYGKTPDGTQDILIPIPDKIRESRDKIFISSPDDNKLTEDNNEETRVRSEAAKITILNGCYDPEKVNKTVEILQSYGIQVISIQAGTQSWTNTMTINQAKPYTGKFLQDLMGIPTNSVYWKYDPTSAADLTITLADSWCNSL